MADLEEVTIKIWLAGDTPDTIAFELSGIGDPANLAALIEASGLIPKDPESALRDNPTFKGLGPGRLERYGDEILATVAEALADD